MEALKRARVRPRQVRYQAALRPDDRNFDFITVERFTFLQRGWRVRDRQGDEKKTAGMSSSFIPAEPITTSL